MERLTRRILILALLAVSALVLGCEDAEFTEPINFAGQDVEPGVLNLGKETYTLYCRACHGVNGDGNGPAAKGLRPPPRNFTEGTYKFAHVESGYLPTDDDFARIIRHGLNGSAMLPWDISDERLFAVTQYIKTFSERWQDEYEEIGEPILAGEDPFGESRRADAIEEGKKLYHALAQCNSCHPSYATYQEIYDAGVELMGFGKADLGPQMYTTELTDSDYGVMLQPPDFTFHTVRAGDDVSALFESIASGIGGTAMPTWKGSLSDERIWAMAYYVRSLIDIRDSVTALELKQGLREQAEWTPPEQGR